MKKTGEEQPAKPIPEKNDLSQNPGKAQEPDPAKRNKEEGHNLVYGGVEKKEDKKQGTNTDK